MVNGFSHRFSLSHTDFIYAFLFVKICDQLLKLVESFGIYAKHFLLNNSRTS